MTPAQAELMRRNRRTVAELDQQLELLEAGIIRYRRGTVDATGDAIALARRQREALQALIAQVDPDGLTAEG